MLERDFEKKMTDLVKRLGGLCLKFESPGNTGVPDRLIIGTHGNIYFVEMKRPNQSRTAAKQKYWKSTLTKHGCKSFIIHDEKELNKFLEDFKDDEKKKKHFIRIKWTIHDTNRNLVCRYCSGIVTEEDKDFLVIKDKKGLNHRFVKGAYIVLKEYWK